MEKKLKIIKKHKILIICILIIILSIISLSLKMIDRNNTLKVNSNELTHQKNKIVVYITGEVKNPGVYYIDENSRMSNIIDVAGGLTEFADINKLNLAKKLIDSEKVIVPKIQENIESEEDDIDNGNSGKININKASESELTQLPGVGSSTAKKIIEYRKNNTFQSIEDITSVQGIGEAKYNSIKDMICIE